MRLRPTICPAPNQHPHSARILGAVEPENPARWESSTEAAAVSGTAWRRFMRNWPGGVAVVTAALDGRPAGCTINSFMSVSLRPPLLLISLACTSRTLSAITATNRFGINVLAGHQWGLAEQFATGADDKFATVRYCWQSGIPVLEDTSATAVCIIERAIDVADHVLVLGYPQSCWSVDGVHPLIFAGHAYPDADPLNPYEMAPSAARGHRGLGDRSRSSPQFLDRAHPRVSSRASIKSFHRLVERPAAL